MYILIDGHMTENDYPTGSFSLNENGIPTNYQHTLTFHCQVGTELKPGDIFAPLRNKRYQLKILKVLETKELIEGIIHGYNIKQTITFTSLHDDHTNTYVVEYFRKVGDYFVKLGSLQPDPSIKEPLNGL